VDWGKKIEGIREFYPLEGYVSVRISLSGWERFSHRPAVKGFEKMALKIDRLTVSSSE